MVPRFGHAPTSTPTRERVTSARAALFTSFMLLGILTTTFLSRMPTVRDELDVTASGLAALLLFGALGSLVGLLVTGWANARLGSRALLWWSAAAYVVAFSAVAVATALGSPVLFSAGYFAVSFTLALYNVPLNTEAAEVERHWGKAIMPQFHAGFSIGMGVGLAIGAGVSHLGVSPLWHFIGMGVVATIARLALIPAAVLNGEPDPDQAAKGIGGPFATAKVEYRDRRVLLLGVIVFASAMTEMTAAQWMSLSIVDDFGRQESVGDLVYWIFVTAMFVVRFSGAPIIGRWGRVVTLRVSALLAATGVLLFAFAPSFWAVPVAALIWGAGAALNFPIGFSAAADDPKRATASVAAVSTFSTIAGLIVPQIVGRLAAWVDLRHALLLVITGSIASFVLARAVRRDSKLFGSRRAALRRARRDESAVIDAAGQAIPMHQVD